MTDRGLMEVRNPSALFLAERQGEVAGAAVFAGIEGSRPVSGGDSGTCRAVTLATPRRAVVGWDGNRLAMVLAVLEARCGLQFGGNDIYLNVAGGLRIREPAADLAVAAALTSSISGHPVASDMVVFGEVGLSGEVRPVGQMGARLKEAEKLGFSAALMPKRRDGTRGKRVAGELKLHELRDVGDLGAPVRSEARPRASRWKSINDTSVRYYRHLLRRHPGDLGHPRLSARVRAGSPRRRRLGRGDRHYAVRLSAAETVIRDVIENQMLADFAAGAGLFVVALALLTVLAQLAARQVRDSAASNFDRSLGFAFGVLRGVILVSLLYLSAAWFWGRDNLPDAITEARTFPLIEGSAEILLTLVPEDARASAESATGLARKKADRALSADKALRRLLDPSRNVPQRPRAAASRPRIARRNATKCNGSSKANNNKGSARMLTTNPFDDDHLHEECAVFGIYGHPEAAAHAALGLHALQHRGQEAAGIVTHDGTQFRTHRGIGLVGDIFAEQSIIERLKGNAAIGHTRYSTTGEPMMRNVQPLFAELAIGGLAIAHNGNLTNARAVHDRLVNEGCIFQSTTDTEIIVHLMATRQGAVVERLVAALRQVEGAYSIAVMAKDCLIGVRDPHGVRPLALGRLGDSYIIASESCAFDIIGGEFVRDIEPGELVVINENGVFSHHPFPPVSSRFCIFEHIYFAKPDSVIGGTSVYEGAQADRRRTRARARGSRGCHRPGAGFGRARGHRLRRRSRDPL